jgi:hypothetical protein
MICTAKTKRGTPCKSHAVKGAKVCIRHGAAAPQVKAKAAVRAEVMRWTLGDAVDDPGEVLLRLVTQSRMRADAYAVEIERKVNDLNDNAPTDSDGDPVTLESILVGETWVSVEGGGSYKSGEYIRGLVQLEAQERDRLGMFAAKAIAAGLAERSVRVAERQGEMLAELLGAVLADPEMGLTSKQREAMPGVFRRHLTLVQRG